MEAVAPFILKRRTKKYLGRPIGSSRRLNLRGQVRPEKLLIFSNNTFHMREFEPSQYQQAVFDWVLNGSGNAIVNAVAGSGKTTTLVEVSKILNKKRLFFAAFNKHIVGTLSKRLPDNASCQTIHSIGYSCLRRRFGNQKIETKESKYRSYCKRAAKQTNETLMRSYDNLVAKWTPNDGDFPDMPPRIEAIQEQLEKMITLSRCTLADVEDIHSMNELVNHFSIDCPIDVDKIQHLLRYILDEGEMDAADSQIIDFTDMLWLPYRWKLKTDVYDWILIDEAQDLNAAQLNLVCKMADSSSRMLFVGDPQQAIYGFSGADSNSFYKIKESINAMEFPLSICYRCPRKVVELAQAIVASIEVSPDAIDGEVSEIDELAIFQLLRERDWVLCRSTEPLVTLCFKLLSKRVHARVKGKEIGKSLIAIIAEVEKLEGFTFENFGFFLASYQDERISKISQKPDTEKQIMDFNDQIASISVCHSSFGVQSVESLKFELQNLFSDQGAAITLCTIHRAKGLEESRIFILNYGTLPLKWDKQKSWQVVQEQNLKYVSLTRTKHSLFLVKSFGK